MNQKAIQSTIQEDAMHFISLYPLSCFKNVQSQKLQKKSLQQIDFHGTSHNPTLCSCYGMILKLIYSPWCHIVIGDINIVRTVTKIWEIFCARARNTENLSRFYGTRILISSWTRMRSMPDSGSRERMSKMAHFPIGISRSPVFWNIELESFLCDPEVVR